MHLARKFPWEYPAGMDALVNAPPPRRVLTARRPLRSSQSFRRCFLLTFFHSHCTQCPTVALAKQFLGYIPQRSFGTEKSQIKAGNPER